MRNPVVTVGHKERGSDSEIFNLLNYTNTKSVLFTRDKFLYGILSINWIIAGLRWLWLFLAGNVINIQSGKWVGFMSGLGAGLDSFYEYLLKVIIFTVFVYALDFSIFLSCLILSV